MTLTECLFAYIIVSLKTTVSGREAKVRITQKGLPTTDSVSMTSVQLNEFFQKFEETQFDGIIINTENWPTPFDIPSYEMRLFKYACGEFYSLEFRNHRVKIDNTIILSLLFAEEKLHAFLTAE